jgi:hypothetical protein
MTLQEGLPVAIVGVLLIMCDLLGYGVSLLDAVDLVQASAAARVFQTAAVPIFFPFTDERG